MDITPTSTPTPTPTTTTTPPTQTTNTHTTKSPDLDTETPIRIQPTKPVSFTNGVLKRHHPLHHHHHLHHHPPIIIIYKECLKNHAATLGGHALDGCGEFMPSPTATATDPTSLKCAACGCHRNFHRREPEDPPLTPTTTIEYQPHHRHHPPPPPQPAQPHRSPNSASPPPISSSYYPSAPHMLLALSGNLQAPHDNNNIPISPSVITNPSSSTRKRFRTKFSQSQKEKMFQFAERVGWKMQKRDDELVREFCNEVSVDKGVLKVWMHNNKNTLAKRDLNGGSGDGSRDNNNNNLDNTHNDENNHNNENNNENNNNKKNINNNNGQNMDHFESDAVAHVGTNGSSSSS